MIDAIVFYAVWLLGFVAIMLWLNSDLLPPNWFQPKIAKNGKSSEE